MVEDLGRVFVAIGLPADLRLEVDDYASRWRVPGRRVDATDLHITLRFVGQLDVVGYERLVAALDETAWPGPFAVRLTGLGVFPNPRSATVAWVGIDDSAPLRLVHGGVEDACERAGLGREERPFRPHVTVARIRPPADLRPLLRAASVLNRQFDVRRVTVLRSTLGGAAPRYEPLESFDL